MDITVKRESLLKPLQAISSIVEKRQTLSILANVLIIIKNDTLTLTGTDLEILLVGNIPLDGNHPVEAHTVSARKLCDIVKSLPENVAIHLRTDSKHLKINALDSSFNLNILDAGEYPQIDSITYAIDFNMPQTNLREAFSKVYFAMAQQDIRNYLNGTFLEITSESIRCVAADGHRLAIATLKLNTSVIDEIKAIIPRKSVLELMRLLDNDLEVNIQIAPTRICFTTSAFSFSTKLISANFPDYNRLIPKGNLIAEGNREDIKRSLARTAILSNEKVRGIRFQLENNTLWISATNTDHEHAQDCVEINYTGEKIEIGFNVIYLMDALSNLPGDRVRLIFTNPNSAVLIQSVDDPQYIHVIMPLRL